MRRLLAEYDTPVLTVENDVVARFNAYAYAVLPFEIGGLLKVEQTESGAFIATDLHVFSQSVSEDYFELDETELAKFNLDLVKSGRADEIAQWKSLVHSHPNMTAHMSRTDRENLQVLAGSSFAFSVIFSSFDDPQDNGYVAHYAQTTPIEIMIHGVTKRYDKIGFGDLSDAELEVIQADAAEKCGLEIPEGKLVEAAAELKQRGDICGAYDTTGLASNRRILRERQYPGPMLVDSEEPDTESNDSDESCELPYDSFLAIELLLSACMEHGFPDDSEIEDLHKKLIDGEGRITSLTAERLFEAMAACTDFVNRAVPELASEINDDLEDAKQDLEILI